MNEPIIYPFGDSDVIGYAAEALRWRGIAVVHAPAPEVTHLLLPISQRTLPEDIGKLSKDVTVIGGDLDSNYRHINLLQDEQYLSRNAMITAHIALTLAAQHMPIIFDGCPTLILGWGRIGKCLMKLLGGLGAEVTVAARKDADRSIVNALGCHSVDISGLSHSLRRYRLIINTVPYPVIGKEQLTNCRQDCFKMDLATQRGIEGTDVLHARGLPGKYAPESTGRLIAQTVHRHLMIGGIAP